MVYALSASRFQIQYLCLLATGFWKHQPLIVIMFLKWSTDSAQAKMSATQLCYYLELTINFGAGKSILNV